MQVCCSPSSPQASLDKPIWTKFPSNCKLNKLISLQKCKCLDNADCHFPTSHATWCSRTPRPSFHPIQLPCTVPVDAGRQLGMNSISGLKASWNLFWQNKEPCRQIWKKCLLWMCEALQNDKYFVQFASIQNDGELTDYALLQLLGLGQS